MADTKSSIDPTNHLPLPLLRSDTIPPAPTRSDLPGSTIDWLPNFSDLAWIAYAASSLLVISHLPSPLSPGETAIGPIFRQVFELSGESDTAAVTAVSWSPASPSVGEVAAATGNCVWLFGHDSATSKGSFCWSQNAILVQSTKVETVGWTGSGDGIVSGGAEVVLWRRNNRFWEIAWKFKAELPQTLVSASWSIEGPFATAAYANIIQAEGSSCTEERNCAYVFQRNGQLAYAKVELNHPQPVSMVQWRPRGRQSNEDGKTLARNFLLTCCLDGTVRLWCEIDSGRGRKFSKDSNYHKTMRRSFCVAAVIEINQTMRGILGKNVFVTWAKEVEGVSDSGDGMKKFFSSKVCDYAKADSCEWIVGFGSGRLVNLWAVHCLDDISPMRFPRVTLWKTLELKDLEVGHPCRTDLQYSWEKVFLNKVAVLRNDDSSTPKMCSLIQLVSSNSLVWSLLYPQNSVNIENALLNEDSIDGISCSDVGLLNLDGHTGKILQVAVHPYSCEVELAASLDSNGLVLFWSLSTISNCIVGRPTLIPTWDICGKLGTGGSCSTYTSLRWAPAISDQELFLLMGHVGGIDCFIIKLYPAEDEYIQCHYLCTIPFTGHGPFEEGPINIFSLPLLPTKNEILKSHKFLLLGVWLNGFQAISWEVSVHSCDLSGNSCNFNFEVTNAADCSMWDFGTTFSGNRYSVHVSSCSSQFPEPHKHDPITSFAVAYPHSLVSQSSVSFTEELYSTPAYTLATGCRNGNLKLWRSKLVETPTSNTPWDLVGMIRTHQGPISAVCLSDSGRKIATICKAFHSNAASSLSVWESALIAGSGAFVLEYTTTLSEQVVALNWLSLSNGQLLLGVCMQNQLCIYAQRCCSGQTLLNSEQFLKGEIWYQIAFAHATSPINDFHWGPRATTVVVHDSFLSVISQWMFLPHGQNHAEVYPNHYKNNCLDFVGEKDKNVCSAIFTDRDTGNLAELSREEGSKECSSSTSASNYMKRGCLFRGLLVSRIQLEHRWGAKLCSWNMLEVAENFGGSIQVYHSEALLMNIFTGNWKRAYSALKHLVECLGNASENKCSTVKSNHIIPQIPVSKYFEGPLPNSLPDKGFQWGGNFAISSSQFSSSVSPFAYNFEVDSSNNFQSSSSTKSEIRALIEPLEKFYKLASITSEEKIQILAIIDLLGEITNPNSAYGSLDEPGQRFWVALKFQQFHFMRRFGKSATLDQLVIDSSMIVWAYHSDCEENLIGSVLPNEPSWPEMRNLGAGFWFTNVAQLRAKMEKLARLQFLKNKNPRDCALLYVALNRIQVLAGLFKISKDEKDKPLFGFLSRNFKEEKNKAAALKNAYVLLGKHQLELAIAFFLLGGDISSAINVCAKNLGDGQLALVICRLLEGCNGPAEHHLITKIMLPSAIEKGNNWLASLLEWELRNYYNSFMRMFDLHIESDSERTVVCSDKLPFLNPNIGLYCLTLATKNSMRNAVGDHNTAILGRWAILMTAIALDRHGLPLEALECLSSSLSVLGSLNQGNISNSANSNILHEVLKANSSNWLSDDAASNLEHHYKLDLALKYFSKLIREHPGWEDVIFKSPNSERYENHQYAELLESFQEKFYTGLQRYELKFSVLPLSLISKILVSLYNCGLFFVGYDLLCGYVVRTQSQDKIQTVNRIFKYHFMNKPLLKVTEETSLLFSRFIVACTVTCSLPNLNSVENGAYYEGGSSDSNALRYLSQNLLFPLRILRASLRMIHGSKSPDLINKPLMILDLIEYAVYFACAWLQRNCRALFLAVKPILFSHTDGHTDSDIDLSNLNLLLSGIPDRSQSIFRDDQGESQVSKIFPEDRSTKTKSSIPEDEQWRIIGACLWQHMLRFLKSKLHNISNNHENGYFSGLSHGRLSSRSSVINLEFNENSSMEEIELVSLTLVKLLKTSVGHVSSFQVKHLASYLHTKIECRWDAKTLVWLEEFNQCQRGPGENLVRDIGHLDAVNEKDVYGILWDICAHPKIISESFAAEKINFSDFFYHKPSKGWCELYDGMRHLDEDAKIHNQESIPSSQSVSSETGAPARHLPQDGATSFGSQQRDMISAKDIASFLSPREVLKRNGDILEALCINSIHQGQAAVASNRKGILYFNWEDVNHFRDESEYIWSTADWPLNGWASSGSSPNPTCVSPSIGLGSKKGAHSGATIGKGSSAKPRRDLTGGAAFGIPGYAGIGASGLGWETQEEFEEVVDPPPTAEKISTRSFCSHPSSPIFLAGSSNTHIYLWEFGKDKATATYGVLPAANAPPPYALASISALQFDHYGHRFASAALDGTVCSWQLEVGGRSNVRPTETSHCFESHASDVTYITSTGSIISVAGYNPSGANVVIWDTLAPPTTSQASIKCHDGGARSLSVFDNDIGSGSISPLIVTGGKGGDVGIHDFRYIATGKTKRHKSSSGGQTVLTSKNMDTPIGNGSKAGEQNLNGMVWYIPKAHSGSVTKIATIPNTSLFLTGSKDGDVKLWDAKETRMVFHWPKLHERHTFLQPGSRVFGEIVRVAVTDIQVVSHGFLTCGGDGSVKLVELEDRHFR